MTINKKARLFVFISLFLMALFLLFSAVLFAFFEDTAFNLFKVRFYLISYTKSMEPELNYNDLIAVKRFDFDKLKEGDVITFLTTFEDKEITVTHKIERIYEKDGERYLVTRGVNLPANDTIPVTKNGTNGTNIYVGKLIAKSTIIGNLIAYLNSKMGASVIIINLSALFIIFISIKKLKQEDKFLFEL